MELTLKLLVVLVQLALAGFVMWGGWLCFRDWLRPARAGAATQAGISAYGFERVASLVLLALLCTALVGLG
jgi:hypothetical protein